MMLITAMDIVRTKSTASTMSMAEFQSKDPKKYLLLSTVNSTFNSSCILTWYAYQSTKNEKDHENTPKCGVA